MLTGVSYMSHHNPKHIETDLADMVALKLDDALVCLQENDFIHFTGKVDFTAKLARDVGIRPIAIFWGAMNLFGGGRSSQFLLEHPDCFQVARDGPPRAAGCYVNSAVVARIQQMIDVVVDAGYAGYFNEMDAVAKGQNKVHHEWLECWRAQSGTEERILEMGKRIIRTQPDALYVWAWHGQIGTAESCANPMLAWSKAVAVLTLAKEAV